MAFPRRQKVFVPWPDYGICKYWMAGGAARCYSGAKCHWMHPPEAEIKELWENPAARLKYLHRANEAAKAATGRPAEAYEREMMPFSQRAPPMPLPPPSPQPARENNDRKPGYGGLPWVRSGAARAPPPPPPPPPPPCPHPTFLPPFSESNTQRPGYDGLPWVRRGDAAFPQLDGEARGVNEVQHYFPARAEEAAGQPRARHEANLEIGPREKPRALTTPITPYFAQTVDMGAKRMSNGETKPVGPHPSTIRVAAPYTTQASLDKRLQPPTLLDVQDKSVAEAREDAARLQGVTWLDSTRRALQLPVRTFTTACVLYHKFRLAHPGADYNWADAAAASLLASCKIEDTLKKSKDILAAAWNLKAGSHDALGADDVVFEAPSRLVIGLERLVLEASGFDFRSRTPHNTLIKIAKSLPASDEQEKVAKVAWTVLTDLHRTFAPLKQTSATLAVASLELAAHLQAAASGSGSSAVRDQLQAMDTKLWSTTREEVMETLLDALDCYTHHTGSTILGTKYSLDDFLRIRLALNKECTESNIPRYTTSPEPSIDRPAVAGVTLQVANGHPTPVSPSDQQAQQAGVTNMPSIPEGGGTLRFMLNPQLASEEKAEVQKYFVEEWEEYEEEIEIPLPRPKSRDRERDSQRREDAPPARLIERERERRAGGVDLDDRRSMDSRRSRDEGRDRDRDRLRDRDREVERERVHARDRERDRRYDRRYDDDRDRYDRRDRRYDDRRYDDDRRRDRR